MSTTYLTLTPIKLLTKQKELIHLLPDVWEEAAGLLKGKQRVDPLRYQRHIRQEWKQRLERLSNAT